MLYSTFIDNNKKEIYMGFRGTRATTLVKRINEAFPKINDVEARGNNTIFLGDVAEGGTINGVSACDYYGYDRDPEESIWVMGVHHELAKMVGEAGFFVECQDPGTYFAYRM